MLCGNIDVVHPIEIPDDRLYRMGSTVSEVGWAFNVFRRVDLESTTFPLDDHESKSLKALEQFLDFFGVVLLCHVDHYS